MIFPYIWKRLQGLEVVKQQLLKMIDEASWHCKSLEDEIIAASDYSDGLRDTLPQHVDLQVSKAATILQKYFSYLNLKTDFDKA